MRLRVTTAFLVATLLPIVTVEAQTSGSASGRYATHTISDDAQSLPDGSSVILSHYHQTTFADGTHPIDNLSSTCVGKIKVGADGAPMWGSGSCFSESASGDGSSFWWRLTEAGTDNCPDICGEWGYFDGYGKFEGIEGIGSWQRTTLFPDGSSGTWQGRYSLP